MTTNAINQSSRAGEKDLNITWHALTPDDVLQQLDTSFQDVASSASSSSSFSFAEY